MLIEKLRKPRVKDWNNAFLSKQRWMTIWQEWKKSNSLIGETKNRLKNLKHNYVAFSLPCNLNKKHGIFMFFFFFKDFRFKNLIFRFIHRVSAFKKNCLTCSFSLQYQYILQPTVLENKESYQLDGVKLTQHFIL